MDQIPKLGYIPDPPDPRDFQLLTLIAPPVMALPSKVSYREQMTPVKHQDGVGACTAFAALAIKEFYDSKEYNQTIDLSEEWLYYKCKEIDGYLGEGTYPRVAADVLLKQGVCEEKFWPYETQFPPKTRPAAGAELNALQYKISSYAYVPPNLTAVKTALAQNGPLLIGVKVWKNFFSIGPTGVVPTPAGEYIGGHAMCVVGYDDTKQMLEIKNSWGTTFGDNGYVWLPYSLFNSLILGSLLGFVDIVNIQKHWTDWPNEALIEQDIVYNKGIFKGYPDGTFHPWEPLTRRHVALVLARLNRPVDTELLEDYNVATRGWVKSQFPNLQWNNENWNEPLTRFQLVILLAREIAAYGIVR